MKQNMKRLASPKNLSIAIALVTLGWIATGFIFGTHRDVETKDAAESGSDIGKLLKVETLAAKPFTRLISINGSTEANRMVELKPEVEGKIVELPVKKGEMVAAGQIVVRLDERDRKEKLAEAKAKVNARTIEFQASTTLEQKGYRPRMGLADSKATLEQARVELAQAQLNIDNTNIKAPFAGRLEELNIEVGDFVLAGFFGSMDGKVMARVVEDNPILVVGQISEKDLPFINRDAEIKVQLSDGREFSGRIEYLSQYADTESRSFLVEVKIDNPEHTIPVGITATVKLPASKGSAYLVSSSVLALDDAGKVGVKLVDDAGIVQFRPVEILANNDEGLWIGGLPDTVRMITQGQAFVSAGQKYDATLQEKTP